ncbi:MAG TPA: hypothetical protein VGL61_33835 [Kofleriaceae bacterium]
MLACCLCSCGGKKQPGIAELTKADGPVEREAGGGSDWTAAKLGEQFYLGDAARTADGGAELKLAGTQLVAMTPHTVLRFEAGKGGAANVHVELGQVDIANNATVGIAIGDVQIQPGAKVRFTASQVELLIGKAELEGNELAPNTPTGLVIGKVMIVDAGVADAAPADAAVGSGDVSFTVTGKGAEVQQPGEKTWKAIDGSGTVPVGAKLRLRRAGVKATLISGTTSLELSGASSQLTVRENLLMGIDLGNGVATVPAATTGAVGVPGGEIAITSPQGQAGEAHIEVDARGEAKVAMAHGTAKLVGRADGATLELAGGESATMLKAGEINPGVVIPRYFDLRLDVETAPRSFSIHDPKGATAVQFGFGSKCPTGGTIEMDRDGRFRTPRVSEGKEAANMLVPYGSWAYRLKCANGSIGGSGQVLVIRDSGRRPLPPKPGKNKVDADGRVWAISYQSLIPNLEISFPGGGAGAYKLHVATGGAEQVFDGTTNVVEVPGSKLKEATYTFWFDKDGVKQDNVSTLKINFDQTAAQVYIESPIDGQPFGTDVDVRGAALPGWTASIDGADLPIVDPATRRFHAKVGAPTGGAHALAIKLSHPQRGVHYYLRRGTN